MASPETAKQIRRVLVANRGEIALRVMRAARDLGISPVAVYGDGEENARHVQAADDAYRLPSDTGMAYLNIPAIIEAAQRSGADAIHPGYGFLAENASFADACAVAGLVFVGPPGSAIRAMGDKVEARALAIAANVPIVPGTPGPVATVEEARVWAEANGYPVAIKAAAGGGGRGFRVAHSPDELEEAFLGSTGEAQRYFANPIVYLERYLVRPRHIEVQVFADDHGNVVSLGERDCSLQRRHQKLVEETPSPAVTPEMRKAFGDAACGLARAVGYRGAGTCEFMLAQDGRFYFLEMNTRIQVEHTVTEAVTGIDLVQEQFHVAMGRPLSFTAETVEPRGHAIQCRINAEDAGNGFKPGPGTITGYREPGGFGIRIDSAMFPGGEISPLYDSLIAKLVVWGRDRTDAIARMRRALDEFLIEGVPTTIQFHRNVMDHPVFIAEGPTTAFLPEHPEVIPPPAIVVAPTDGAHEPAALRDVLVEVNGRRLNVRLHGDFAAAAPAGAIATRAKPAAKRRDANAGPAGNELTSPIQGTVLRVSCEPGQTVKRGDIICVVEAMKMENEIPAHRDGVVGSIGINPGDSVKIGAILANIGE